MRYLIVGLAAVSLLAAEASAQSSSGNPLDKPAQRSGARSRSWTQPQPNNVLPAGNGGKQLEASSTPKAGLEIGRASCRERVCARV